MSAPAGGAPAGLARHRGCPRAAEVRPRPAGVDCRLGRHDHHIAVLLPLPEPEVGLVDERRAASRRRVQPVLQQSSARVLNTPPVSRTTSTPGAKPCPAGKIASSQPAEATRCLLRRRQGSTRPASGRRLGETECLADVGRRASSPAQAVGPSADTGAAAGGCHPIDGLHHRAVSAMMSAVRAVEIWPAGGPAYGRLQLVETTVTGGFTHHGGSAPDRPAYRCR